MKKKPIPIDFKEQTPALKIKQAPHNRLYEKAFLTENHEDSREDTEYCQNTTTWD